MIKNCKTYFELWLGKITSFSCLSFMGILVLLSMQSCKSTPQLIDHKVTSDGTYKEAFYITEKTPNPKGKRKYYWYKSQEVFSSQNNYGGPLLNGPYTKHYYTNELSEKGTFKKGLKQGSWTSWHQNGVVAQVSKWQNGIPKGKFVTRDNMGNTLVYGSYKNGKRNGDWVYPVTGDTLYFHKGTQIHWDSLAIDTLQKPSFFKRVFSKKYRQVNQLMGKQKDTLLSDSTKTGFFKRIFKKKKPGQEKKVIKPVNKKEQEELMRLKRQNSPFEKKSSKAAKKGENRPVKSSEKKSRPNKEGFFKRLFGKRKDKKVDKKE